MACRDLSILIPARNELFLQNTIDDILKNKRANTEIIVVLDGYWPYAPIKDNADITIIHHSGAIGQRAATNEAARLSTAKYIMKCDAHCAFEKGFDVKLIASMQPEWTTIPRMYNLHVFNWQCKSCGNETYQGPTPVKCEACNKADGFERKMIWSRRKKRMTDFCMFDKDLHFQYWSRYGERPEAQGPICDVMGALGACWLMCRERYWALGGLDEEHGSWGQMGTEISCKTWLSGGRQVVNKNTWFAHMFRTQGGDFGFPYKISNSDIAKSREHSRNLWINNTWGGAVLPLSWLVKKFAPVPTWEGVYA